MRRSLRPISPLLPIIGSLSLLLLAEQSARGKDLVCALLLEPVCACANLPPRRFPAVLDIVLPAQAGDRAARTIRSPCDRRRFQHHLYCLAQIRAARKRQRRRIGGPLSGIPGVGGDRQTSSAAPIPIVGTSDTNLAGGARHMRALTAVSLHRRSREDNCVV